MTQALGNPARVSAVSGTGKIRRRLGWLVGIAALGAVIVVVTQVSEQREFAQMLSHAQPWWIAVALAMQACTYVALAQVWRTVARVAHHPLSIAPTIRIALAKLFVDQTLPSLGISGGVLLASALQRRGLSRPQVAGTVIIDVAAYYSAYAVGLSVAITIAVAAGHAGTVVLAPALAFIAIALGLAIGALWIPRARRLPNLPGLRRAGAWLTEADRRLTRSPLTFVRAASWHLSIIALDSATLWALLGAAGVRAPIAGVFASFMISSLARTLSIVPGGLGVFEGVSVLALDQIGVPVAAALSATLLFRGISYWLPMIPGFLASRGLR